MAKKLPKGPKAGQKSASSKKSVTAKQSKAMEAALKAVENIGKAKDSTQEIEYFLSEALEEAFETIEKIKSTKTWN